ncbi:sugar ABC transporter permease [Actinosynnema sp. ALI-1.44]|uniref:ABC transporter permease n=1 Tax=Actinosynnema sp. ALI-1.44 TaxID=1933779 RepID=UPI00097CA7F3|nr:ABC transporter permease [Actinosynnema sp. ALI-1.44]ONI85257.1 sugar ABC transporter permease [Actinosynnema sp. ALI-1.44]
MTTDAVPTTEQRSLRTRLLSANTFWIALVLLALVVVFGALAPDTFLTFLNFQNLFVETSVLLVVAVGMTFVIITGGIDLSVGSVLIFASMISAKTMQWISPGQQISQADWGVIAVGLAVALAGGAVWGLINGLLVARANIPPLIVTLGTLGAALGAASLLNDGTDIRPAPSALSDILGFGTLEGNIPNMVVVAAVITVLFGLVLHTTRFGRYTYAIGSNAEATRRAGIGAARHLTNVYLLSGVLAGAAGFMSMAYFQGTTISGNVTLNLSAIAGVVLGGTSLFGGVGTIVGTVIGVFIPAVLQKGFNIINVQQYWQQIAVGAVLVAAVWFDQQRRRRSKN